MRDDTKLALVREAMRQGNWHLALKRAARFRRLGEHAEAIRRAANAINNPSFYEQLGHDPAQLEAEGIAALKERFSKTWEDAQNE